ncbi:MAG: glycosyltransferase family 2 protein [Usitatibacter sp.]
MRVADVSIVTYEPDMALLRQLLASMSDPAPPARLNLFIHDNSAHPAAVEALRAELETSAFARVEIHHGAENVGFGRGHNANAVLGTAPNLLVINPDCVLEPGALATLLDYSERDAPYAAAWEMRQIPYEHPKAYDPVTLETPWTSGAATLFRRAAFESVGGFDAAIFLYGEDVDLSWRLRASGNVLRYVPRAAVVHRTYATKGEVKPMQAYGAVFAGLALRTRYGSAMQVMRGFAMLAAEILAPESFPGRSWGMMRTGLRYLRHMPRFLGSRVRCTPRFRPQFAGWSYEERRDGAFHETHSRRGRPQADFPLVSIMIRTHGKPAWVRQALATCAHQTYPNLEVVVVEDGEPLAQDVVREFSPRLAINYQATGQRVGRARAGNLAMAQAKGEWMNFLDDDDVFFADHVEVLVEAARRAGVRGAYGFAWETHTRVIDLEKAQYEEIRCVPRLRQRFDRISLWHQNFMPIQSVLFHRALWERHGGFAEDMEQLEDWNLWTRYTIEDDFVHVEKTTSKYRVPDDPRAAASRQALLDAAYADAVERQRKLRLTLSPREIAQMAESYSREQAMMQATRNAVRHVVSASPALARLASWRAPTRAWLRRMGL